MIINVQSILILWLFKIANLISIPELEGISSDIETLLNYASKNTYNISYQDLDLLISNIHPVFHYEEKNLSEGTPNFIRYRDVNVTYFFDVIISLDNPLVYFTKTNLILNIYYKYLNLHSEKDFSFSFIGPLFGFITFNFGDLVKFEIFKELIRDKQINTVFQREFERHLSNVLMNYPKSIVQQNIDKLIVTVTNSPRIPVDCCHDLGIENATIGILEYEDIQKVGVFYRQYINVQLKISYKTFKGHVLQNIQISHILASTDYLVYGKFTSASECSIRIIQEILNKYYKQICDNN